MSQTVFVLLEQSPCGDYERLVGVYATRQKAEDVRSLYVFPDRILIDEEKVIGSKP